jgi:hypothetical protein
MPRVSRPVDEDKQFGVSTGKTSHTIYGAFKLAGLRTADGLIHHIRIIDQTGKWLRYVLRHDQREYLIVVASIEVLENTQVNCLICVEKGPERVDVVETEDGPRS